VPKSLRHSCRSELTRQGISLSFVTTGARQHAGGFSISVNLLASLRGSDYIIIHECVRGVRHVVSEGIRSGSSLLIVRTARIFTRSLELVPSDARMFQHIAEDSHDLATVRGNFKLP
jgi:hypothetical protein